MVSTVARVLISLPMLAVCTAAMVLYLGCGRCR